MIFVALQITVAILLISVILLQMKGSGLSGAFGGSGEFYRSRRSLEKMLVWITIALSALFAIISIALLIPR
ncbi:MAG: preprotein translocase subunit SecG [Candidatus Levybacteria bacterium]|nr:preprotein translocase subunit SecG [Candidatus Levybacteria bacterium]MBI2190106.1 preprotein translocase subunit SecG [Candidatus Levybacteria bacterium]MBI3070040.1 preprotein translocase subunit SecG [Candidatus Levybacteria bacterium]MBI3092659.1 preprotein translocase subunit SecG [Candidatus Levybacteria bacterium]